MNERGTRVYWRPPDWKPPSQRTRGDEPPDLAGGGALCVRPGVVPDRFHPPGDGPGAALAAQRTIDTYCTPCPVRDPCRRWGLQVGRGTGIWGGLWLDSLSRRGIVQERAS